ncbi:hypothetical protein [Amnibacterium sp.]|uniref:hypothetical protein n=1 Tax=Amnibacterium sp. TaxID=1872496 RepID=UPI003F7CA742
MTAPARATSESAAVSVVVRPYWLSSWFLRAFARPFVVVDGREHPARWSRPLRVQVRAGARSIGAGIRYPGTRRLLGYRPLTVDATPGEQVELLARNGPLNSEPFFMTVLS